MGRLERIPPQYSDDLWLFIRSMLTAEVRRLLGFALGKCCSHVTAPSPHAVLLHALLSAYPAHFRPLQPHLRPDMEELMSHPAATQRRHLLPTSVTSSLGEGLLAHHPSMLDTIHVSQSSNCCRPPASCQTACGAPLSSLASPDPAAFPLLPPFPCPRCQSSWSC